MRPQRLTIRRSRPPTAAAELRALGLMKAFAITVVSILVGFGASLVSLPWLAGLAALTALASAYAQYRDTLPFELVFTKQSWHQNSSRDFSLTVPLKQHGKSCPTATVFQGQAPNYSECGTDINVGTDWSVAIGVTEAFEGKLVIK